MALFHLGLSTSGHDPALALVSETGEILFAEATERFVQDKRAWGVVPDHFNHLASALKMVGFDVARDRLRVATTWSRAKADLPVQMSGELLDIADANWVRELQADMHRMAGASLMRLGLTTEMPEARRFDHHLCHAVAACAFAPVEDAACLVIDGEGEVGAVSLFDLRARSLKRRWRSWGPGSLGALYSALTQLCGFDWRQGEEWKVMGLAAFGTVRPELRDALAAILEVDNGRLLLADHATITAMIARLRQASRAPSAPIMDAADLAASGQAAYAQLVDRMLADCTDKDVDTLILSGGCALNSSYNGTIAGRSGFDRLCVPPAPADDGNAIGAALLSYMETAGTTRIPQGDGSPYLGTPVDANRVGKLHHAQRSAHVTDLGADSAERLAACLAEGKIVGVMRGRAEFGPRALGNRSILADPRPAGMKDRVNAAVKGREPYRPFAPVICAEDLPDWFETPQSSPYMSLTLRWRAERAAQVPAVVHADGTGRLQSVTPDSTPWLHRVVRSFGAQTGVPVILNTSFNVMGKPIIHSVEDALSVFMTTGLDAVLIEDTLIEKTTPAA
ncbi:carbamoyl transferase [Rhodobacter sp. NTK016B]|nr:carbamoyltransferase C-terminal domain-containing protein [Rhodobacter sp. NTK016B]MBN8293702.1 carbamoyl transferase [Rhodobacter sp. NTK016B]